MSTDVDSELFSSDGTTPHADPAGTLDELDSLYAMSVEIASLRKLNQVMDRALDYCLQLTKSEFGFVGLIDDPAFLDVAAIKGFMPDKPEFWEQFRRIPIRRTIFGVVVIEGRPNLSNDVRGGRPARRCADGSSAGPHVSWRPADDP